MLPTTKVPLPACIRLAETEDDCREKNPCAFQNCVAFRLALHGFFNETTDYSPRCPGKQHKREKLLALSLFSWQSVRAFSADSFRIMNVNRYLASQARESSMPRRRQKAGLPAE